MFVCLCFFFVTSSGAPRESVLQLGLRRSLRADGPAGAREGGGAVIAAGRAGHSQRVDDRPGYASSPQRRKASGGLFSFGSNALVLRCV